MSEHSLAMRSNVDQLNQFFDQVVKRLAPDADKVWLTELAGQLGCEKPVHITYT